MHGEYALSFAFEVFEGILHALQKFVMFNLVKNFLLIVRVILTFLILRFEDGLYVLAALLVMVTILQAVIFFLYIRIKHPEIKIRIKYVRFEVFRKVIGYSVFVLIFQFASKISFNTDAIVIGSFISVSAIVYFTIGNNFLLYSLQLITGISNVIMPRVSMLDAVKDSHSLQELYFKYSRLTTLLILPICLVFLIFGGDFISIWMGEKYRIISGNILSILTISYLFFLVQRAVAYPVLMGTSNLRFPTLFMATTAILNLLLSIWWGKKYGLYGVAWGTTIPTMLNTVGIIWFMCRTFNVSFGQYLYQGVFSPLSAGVYFAIPALILRNYITIDSYLRISLAVSLSLFCYLIFVLIIYIDKKQKRVLLEKFGIKYAF